MVGIIAILHDLDVGVHIRKLAAHHIPFSLQTHMPYLCPMTGGYLRRAVL